MNDGENPSTGDIKGDAEDWPVRYRQGQIVQCDLLNQFINKQPN